MIVFETTPPKNLELEAVALQAFLIAEKSRRGHIEAADALIELVALLRRFKGGDA